MNKTVRIPSKLYHDLYTRGGDKLVAIYCIIKSSRNGEDKYAIYKSKNNKVVAGYNLIKAKTVLSLSSIQKFVPILIEMGVCSIDFNGNFIVLGGEKLKQKYNCKKLVPISIGKNLKETMENSFIVRLHSNFTQQEKKINKKKYLSELKCKAKYSHKAYTELKRRLKNMGELSPLTDNIILSNKGFSRVQSGEEKKSNGAYLKSKLVKRGLISTERRFKRICQLSYSNYKEYKNNDVFPINYIYNNGWVLEELVSKINLML